MLKYRFVFCYCSTPSLELFDQEERSCSQRTFREVMFLQELTNHDNIIRSVLQGAFPAECRALQYLSVRSVSAVADGHAFELQLSSAAGMTALRWSPRLLNVLKAENDRDLYLTFDFMETDLHAVIRANILEEVHKQYIMYQLFKALKYLHSANLIHRDIKASTYPACQAAPKADN